MIDAVPRIALVVGILLLALGVAAVSTVLVRRGRRPLPAPDPARDPRPALALQHALAAMIDACARQRLAVPGVVLAVVGPERIRLHLSSPAPQAPAPWFAARGGAEWSRPLRGIDASTGALPFGGLIAVNGPADARVFADLGQAHGLISIEGDASATARRWIEEFTHNPWSAGTPITLIGLDELATPSTVSNATVEDVVAAVAAGASGVAFLAELPSGELGAQLLIALEHPDCRWPVILLGESPTKARWRFIIGADGTVANDALLPRPIVPNGATAIGAAA
jgi:hypothetical protein